MVGKTLAAWILTASGVLLLAHCQTPEPEPQLPQSEHSDMPWNTPRPGEGTGAFGGLLDGR